MKETKSKKESVIEPTCDEVVLFKYEVKLARWQEKEKITREQRDWSTMNEARSYIFIIKGQIEECQQYINQEHYKKAKKFIKV